MTPATPSAVRLSPASREQQGVEERAAKTWQCTAWKNRWCFLGQITVAETRIHVLDIFDHVLIYVVSSV